MKDVGRTNSQTEGATVFAASSYTIWGATGMDERSITNLHLNVAVERQTLVEIIAAVNDVIHAH